jgi:hypothetical protein
LLLSPAEEDGGEREDSTSDKFQANALLRLQRNERKPRKGAKAPLIQVIES